MPEPESNINVKSLLIGWVAAAVVLNAGDWVVNNYILDGMWSHFANTHGVKPFDLGTTAVTITYIVVDIVLAFMLVWVYAAIRPRLGPGPGTATIATFVVFGAAGLEFATFGGWLVPWDLFVRSAALSLVSMLIACQAGAWIYKEGQPAFD